MSKITVCIPTMNRLEALSETLDSYMRGSVLPDRVIIADQSTDSNLRIQIRNLLEKYSDKTEFTYIYLEKPSLTAARNAAIKKAETDVVILSDDDVTVKEDTLNNVCKIMQDPGISMIAGLNEGVEEGNSKIGYLFGKKSYFKRNKGHVTKAMLGRFPMNKITDLTETEWAMGFFFAVRKSLLDKWNIGWDENLVSYAYNEDLDFSFTYYKKSVAEGYKCVMSPDVVVWHRVSKEWRVPARKHTMMYVLNREYLLYKHNMGVGAMLLTHWCNFGDTIFRGIKHQPVKDIIDAQIVCFKHRKELREGIINPEWYSE